MPAKKKSFTATNYSDPAAEMLSAATAEGTSAPKEQDKATDTTPKTKRLNLILRPYTIEQAQKVAYIKHMSVNEMVGQMLDTLIAESAEAIETYDKLFDKKEE